LYKNNCLLALVTEGGSF